MLNPFALGLTECWSCFYFQKFAAGKLSSKKNLSARQNNLMSPGNRNRNNNREKRVSNIKFLKIWISEKFVMTNSDSSQVSVLPVLKSI